MGVTNHRKAKPTPADKAAAKRLRAAWDERKRDLGLTQDKMAELLGGSQGLVSQYLNGHIPLNYKTLLTFARALEIPAESIRDDLPEQQFGAAPSEADWSDVPGYAHAIALGDGSLPDDYAEAHKLKFRTSSLRKMGLLGQQLEVYYGRGDSMEPRIREGDAMLVDRSDTTPRDEAIFVLESDEGAVAKRLMEIGGRWFVVSDNPHDPKWRKPVPLEGKRPFRIVGRVRWIGSWEG